jgi:hypothetical protein
MDANSPLFASRPAASWRAAESSVGSIVRSASRVAVGYTSFVDWPMLT